MKKIALGTLLTGALVLPQSTHASLTTGKAEVTMNLPLFAKVTGLDDFALTLSSGRDGDVDAVYNGSDSFNVESNGQISITVNQADLALDGSNRRVNQADLNSIAAVYDIDGIGASITTTADEVHNADHVVNASVKLTSIDGQKAGDYVASFTITISAAL
jgi:hypothetical protein